MHLTTPYATNLALGTIYREELFYCYLVLEANAVLHSINMHRKKDRTVVCTVQTDMRADVHIFTDTELIAR